MHLVCALEGFGHTEAIHGLVGFAQVDGDGGCLSLVEQCTRGRCCREGEHEYGVKHHCAVCPLWKTSQLILGALIVAVSVLL